MTPDGRTLFVANADNNDVCVVDVAERGKSHVRGFIPSAWYPTSVHVTADGTRVIIGSGKGLGTHPNPVMTPIDPNAAVGVEYHAFQLKGLLSFVDLPDAEKLAAYTKQVYANTPYTDALVLTPAQPPARPTAIPTKVGDPSPIRHVLYIIKENRTYDQVFGDIAKGNGDPKLTLFGRAVTPNHHALAEEFVLLDNLYCNGEVSADGHPWSTSAAAERLHLGSGAEEGAHGAGLLSAAPDADGPQYRALRRARAHGAAARPGGIPISRGSSSRTSRVRAVRQDAELHHHVAGRGSHAGHDAGAFTPKASVASNDVALGQIVEAVSHSKYWNEFAIFVIEDDAQNGPDSVDSHRTVGLVISPYTRRQHLDSTMSTTTSMLRTMELILGLPPLTQHDAAATPMFESFTNTPTLTPYQALPARIDVMTRNTDNAYGAKQSARMDWSDYDRINDEELNEILWHSIKGLETPMPAPVRRALPMHDGRMHAPMSAHAEEEDQDEDERC